MHCGNRKKVRLSSNYVVNAEETKARNVRSRSVNPPVDHLLMDRETVDGCVFCGIVDGVEEAQIILQNEELVCFHDIDPAAPHHYLVVPRQHMINIRSLHRGHIQMVKKMADMGRAALVREGVDNMDNVRIGFHLPPYTSVDHLHLHVLAPASEILYYMSYKFIPKTESFICVESLCRALQGVPPPGCCF